MLRMKAKNVDEITQPPLADDDVRDSVPLTPYHRKPDSTRSDRTDFTFTTQPSARSEARSNAIQQAVDKFLDKLRATVDAQELTAIGQRIGAYFVSIADTFQAALPGEHDDAAEEGRFAEVVGNFRQMIPANLWPHFPVTDVAQLFRNLVTGCQLDAQPERRRIQPVDLMHGIMEDTLDTLSTLQPTPTTQTLITESLKNVIVGMSVEDVQRPEVMSQMLQFMSAVTTKPVLAESINEQTILESVMEHGQENYVDDLTTDKLMDVINAIVEGLLSMEKTE